MNEFVRSPSETTLAKMREAVQAFSANQQFLAASLGTSPELTPAGAGGTGGGDGAPQPPISHLSPPAPPPPCSGVLPPNPWVGQIWLNWSKILSTKLDSDYVWPTSVNDLVAIVKDALSDPKDLKRVRAAGSSWSYSDATMASMDDYNAGPVTQQILVRTHSLNRTLGASFPINGADYLALFGDVTMPAGVVPDLLLLKPPPPHQVIVGPTTPDLFHVEAGITVRELYLRLDSRRALANAPDQVTDPIEPDNRWAIPTAGASGGQTLAGALSTGTHGGDFHYGALADMVRAIHLVGPDGRQWWIEPKSDPITDPDNPAALKNVIGNCVEVRHDDDLFNSALVSVGCFGIIYAVVIDVRKQFNISKSTTRGVWQNDRVAFLGIGQGHPLPAKFSEIPPQAEEVSFCELVINPWTGDDHLNEVFVTAKAEDHTFDPKSVKVLGNKTDWTSMLCWDVAVGNIAMALVPFVGGMPFIPFVWYTLKLMALAVDPSKHNIPSLMGLIVEIATAAVAFQIPFVGKQLVKNALGSVTAKTRPLTGGVAVSSVSWDMRDTLTYTAVDQCQAFGSDSIEIAFDAQYTDWADFVDKVIERVNQADFRGGYFSGYVAVRFTGRSRAHLSMSQFDRTAYVEIAVITTIQGNEGLIAEFEGMANDIAAKNNRAAPHWGQRNWAWRQDLMISSVAYGDHADGSPGQLTKWKQSRKMLLGQQAFNPFDNYFGVRCGLLDPA